MLPSWIYVLRKAEATLPLNCFTARVLLRGLAEEFIPPFTMADDQKPWWIVWDAGGLRYVTLRIHSTGDIEVAMGLAATSLPDGTKIPGRVGTFRQYQSPLTFLRSVLPAKPLL